eukprot:m.186406 g.186406  ORF g.186406 m.186406 type:complete len:132 (+) comp15590_c0_seq17:189-584(+)
MNPQITAKPAMKTTRYANASKQFANIRIFLFGYLLRYRYIENSKMKKGNIRVSLPKVKTVATIRAAVSPNCKVCGFRAIVVFQARETTCRSQKCCCDAIDLAPPGSLGAGVWARVLSTLANIKSGHVAMFC